ncbi:hypothetical protein L9F63_009357, partial [Diploptera punctata]
CTVYAFLTHRSPTLCAHILRERRGFLKTGNFVDYLSYLYIYPRRVLCGPLL